MAQPKSLKLRRLIGVPLSAASISFVMISQAPAAETDAQTNRIKIEYFDPPNPALRGVYELVKKRRTLERIQQVFSPFRLPVELTIRTGSCEGVANAWYIRPAITVCYEYLNQILQSLPAETTPEGVTREDAVIGETFYVFAHEMGTRRSTSSRYRCSGIRKTQPTTSPVISCCSLVRMRRVP
jgi:Putative metallopeptidase